MRNESAWPAADFREYLDAMMARHGIPNDAELARRAGIDASLISNWRSGKQQPSRRSLKKLAAPLELAPAALYIVAGLDDEADLNVSPATLVDPWPPAFHDLLAIYDRFQSYGQGAEVLRGIRRLTAGLLVELEELESQGQPSGRRKAG